MTSDLAKSIECTYDADCENGEWCNKGTCVQDKSVTLRKQVVPLPPSAAATVQAPTILQIPTTQSTQVTAPAPIILQIPTIQQAAQQQAFSLVPDYTGPFDQQISYCKGISYNPRTQVCCGQIILCLNKAKRPSCCGSKTGELNQCCPSQRLGERCGLSDDCAANLHCCENSNYFAGLHPTCSRCCSDPDCPPPGINENGVQYSYKCDGNRECQKWSKV